MPEQLRCLVVDDEPLARQVIKRYIDLVPALLFAGECGNAMDAMMKLQEDRIDLLFLDIRMPQLNGNEFLRVLKNPPRVIFTTAYSDYALEGYELDVLDYLMKPIRFDRFLKAVSKLTPEAHAVANGGDEARPSATDSFVFFRVDRKMQQVLLKDILYIESMKDYLKVVTEKKTLITKQPLSTVEAMLPASGFLRIHRSYIVALAKIHSFNHELVEIGDTEIPIGSLYRSEVRKRLGGE